MRFYDEIKLVICDLDGSLLNHDHKIGIKDQETLISLGKRKILRVIATGRNLYSTSMVLKNSPLIDIAVISTGLGIIDYQTREFLHSNILKSFHVQALADFLITQKVDFMIHAPLPDNHYIFCYDAGTGHPDFMLRWGWYRNFASDLPSDISYLKDASQFVVFLPKDSLKFDQIRNQLVEFSVVRTTSPITAHYDWMEIFPPDVSKGHALQWLCRKYNFDIANTLCLGNDYNDLDMLRTAGKSFVTENAPEDLKSEFRVTVSNNDDPLTEIVRNYEDCQEN